jgi:Autotransporter beta-domain
MGAPTAAQAQSNCSNVLPLPAGAGAGTLPSAFNNWGPSAICAGASAGTSITSAITTMDTAFLTESSAFVGSPSNPRPDQLGDGIWVRGVGGQNTISSSGTAVGVPTGGTFSTSSQERVGFGGVQAGADLGRFNMGGSGVSGVIGVTGGVLDATANEQIGIGNERFNVPFVGGYGAITAGNFFADVQVRDDFYQITATNSNVGLSAVGFNGNAVSVTTSAGYRFNLGSYFVEPSGGLIWSHLNLNTLAAAGGGPFGVPAGVYTFNAVDSTIGRLGVRVGTTVQNANIVWQPFVTASVWDEFASNATSSFVCTGCTFSLNMSDSRVGTFGQFGAGIAAQVLNTGWLGYARVDYRTGDNITGWDITGGLRYQFAWGAAAAPIITKAK